MTNELITISEGLLAGTPVFKGTRVPIESLFDHLEGGASLDEFLEDFPSVTREQAAKVLALAESVLQSNLKLLHESAA
jgi:uncharacterized protein (DUF433 family)